MVGLDSAQPGLQGTRATIAQVARRAGVSTTTVSHVLSGKRAVAARTRGTVLEVIEELGYRPNQAAQHLRTSRSHMTAVVVPDITDQTYAGLARGLTDVLDTAGYGTYVCNTDGVREREGKVLREACDRGVDGIVLAARGTATQVQLSAVVLETPLVCIGDHLPHPSYDSVVADDGAGSSAAADFLLAQGYRSIAIVQGPARSDAARTQGFLAGMRSAKRQVRRDLMVRGDWTRHGGYEAVRGLMTLPSPPDAVFCANDLMAIGALDVARELGLRVPEDLAVVGFDDVEAATIVTPALTTVRNPSYDAGAAAGGLLVSRMTGDHSGPGRTVTLACPLVVRASA